MGITWKDDRGMGTEAVESRDIRERLDAEERDALRQLVSTAVREREVLDAKAWKEIKANGRSAAIGTDSAIEANEEASHSGK